MKASGTQTPFFGTMSDACHKACLLYTSGAISDYSKVIAEYPNFMAGYYQRAEARKKIGDHKGAEQDAVSYTHLS